MEDVTRIKQALLGNWESIAPEIRPSKNPDGSMKPFYLKRAFKYLPADRFEQVLRRHHDGLSSLACSVSDFGGWPASEANSLLVPLLGGFETHVGQVCSP